MKKIFKNEKSNYAIYGTLFGSLFPIVGTILQSYVAHKGISLAFLFNVQKTVPLLWIIDTAPFWLGIFAMFIGKQLDIIQEHNADLEHKIKERTAQLEKELEEHKILIIEKTDACLDAENSKIQLHEILDNKVACNS